MPSSIMFRSCLRCLISAIIVAILLAGCSEQMPQAPTKSVQGPANGSANCNLDVDHLCADQQARFYQAQINASQGRASPSLIRAYIAQQPLLQGEAHQNNIDETWKALTQLPMQNANSIIINADENVLQGWLDLLNIWQTNKQDAESLKAGIEDWQQRYPANPASQSLPTALNNVINFKSGLTQNIALLLPLSGAAQVYGNAIQQGFNAANQLATTDKPPALTSSAAATPDNSANVQVKVYDTSRRPLPALLAQAQQEGATLIVGPLLKNQVAALASAQTPLNILALNQPETAINSPNICYFALSPEDEARDAARHIRAQYKQTPLLIVPQDNFGDRVAQAFADEWQQQGGQTVLKQSIGSYADLKQQVSHGSSLHLSGKPITQTDPTSPAQFSDVTTGGITIPSAPTAVQINAPAASSTDDIDAIYVVASQKELALIKSMLDLSLNTRIKPSIYASSRSHQAGGGPDYRLEMENLQFSDIPLLAGADPALMQKASSQFNNDYSLVRLYAMGIDAYNLAKHLTQIRQLPSFQLMGTTGNLSADGNCVIHRQLRWLQYRQGSLVPVS